LSICDRDKGIDNSIAFAAIIAKARVARLKAGKNS